MKTRHIFIFAIILMYFFSCAQHRDHSHDHTHEHSGQDDCRGTDEHAHEQADSHGHDHDDDSHLIFVSDEWKRLIGLETVKAEIRYVDKLFSVPGRIIPHSDHVADVSAFVDGSVNSVFVQTGDRVEKGDELICITSPEIGLLRAEYEKAKAELDLSRQNLQRRKKLYDENVISDRAFQEAELEFELKKVQYEYAKKRLTAVGVDDKQLAEPPAEHSDAVGATLHIYAPIQGIITERQVRKGQKISPRDRLFEIMDLTTVWCEADIFEKDVHRVHLGQEVVLRVSAYPEKRYSGHIIQIDHTLNRETRTVRVRIQADNKNFELKPGMFASAFIITGRKDNALVIPRDAVLQDESLNIVYVKEGCGFHKHIIRLGLQSDRFVEVIEGLMPGAEIVTKGNYQLHSQSRMSGVDPHAGHVH